MKEKVAIITGGALGIGSVLAESYVKAGFTVVIADINKKAGIRLEKRLNEIGPVKFIDADVSEEKSVKKVIKKASAFTGKIDVLINNAGFGDRKNITERDLSAWNRIIAVNLTGAYVCVKNALPFMPEGSAIINIASTRALMSEKNTEPYSASKGGLLALTHSLAVSLAEKKIRVNAVSPGWIDVSGFRMKGLKGQIKLKKTDHLQHPAGRVGTPYDIAEACLFLSDNDKAGFITGQNLVVDGGMTKKMIYLE